MADHATEPLEATLRRLKDERDEADARYNDALTALDRTLGSPVELPQPPFPVDEHQVAPLNESWNILPEPPGASGLRGKLTRFIWGVVARYFQRQLTFNSQIVDHVNRSVAAARAAHQASETTVTALRGQLAAYAAFQSRLMLYLQQITAYVDTKDRDAGGGALVLNASLSGLAESIAKRWESLAAREHRYEGRTAAIAASHDDLRAMLGVAQQAITTIKRELERVQRVSSEAPVASGFLTAEASAKAVSRRDDAFAAALDAYKYVGFEDQFRGSREVIHARLESYLPLFEGLSDVLDVGCGRGEFLDLLNARGISGRGIDVNHEMAEVCRGRGLDVTEADAVGYLSSLADASLGGIFAAQVVEHLEPGYLLRFLDLAFQKLRPGGRIVLETLNPACWVAFFDSYIRDITHRWPLHPETLKYLVVASGFTKADIEYRSPVPPQDRLQPIAVPAGADPVLADMSEAFNANVEKLNARMFTYMDYALVGQKSGA
jgi:SAM-dependent methyltransferase